jgi:Electron transfer DM13
MIILKRFFFIRFFLVFITVFFISCNSDNEINQSINGTPSYIGEFISSAHPTSGYVEVNQDKTVLKFNNFITDNGPNLDIYLVSDLTNVDANYIDLGSIKGLNGTYFYDLPENTDYSVYKYVVVWCTDFSVNFGYAKLVEQ